MCGAELGHVTVADRALRRWPTLQLSLQVDLNDEALDLAAKELGTTTKMDTVNAALEFVASCIRRS